MPKMFENDFGLQNLPLFEVIFLILSQSTNLNCLVKEVVLPYIRCFLISKYSMISLSYFLYLLLSCILKGGGPNANPNTYLNIP
jgi:hypothetical protein